MAGGGWAVPGRGDPPWDWHRFREVGVSEPDNKLRLRTIGSIGHATGMGGTSFNDRRFLVLARPRGDRRRDRRAVPHDHRRAVRAGRPGGPRSGSGRVAQRVLPRQRSRPAGDLAVRRGEPAQHEPAGRPHRGVRLGGARRGRRRDDGHGHDGRAASPRARRPRRPRRRHVGPRHGVRPRRARARHLHARAAARRRVGRRDVAGPGGRGAPVAGAPADRDPDLVQAVAPARGGALVGRPRADRRQRAAPGPRRRPAGPDAGRAASA